MWVTISGVLTGSCDCAGSYPGTARSRHSGAQGPDAAAKSRVKWPPPYGSDGLDGRGCCHCCCWGPAGVAPEHPCSCLACCSGGSACHMGLDSLIELPKRTGRLEGFFLTWSLDHTTHLCRYHYQSIDTRWKKTHSSSVSVGGGARTTELHNSRHMYPTQPYMMYHTIIILHVL